MDYKISRCLDRFQFNYSDKCALDVAKEVGVAGLDFSLLHYDVRKEGNLYTFGADRVREYFKDVKAYAEKIGIAIPQVHGRLYGFGVDEAGDEAFIKNSELDCIAANALGAKYCVVHTPAITWVGDGHTDDEMFDISDRLFGSILPFAKREGVKIAAETHGNSGKYQKMEFFGYVDNLIECINRSRSLGDYADSICVCVDTGHTNMTVRYGNPSVPEVIRKLGNMVEVLHLHDNDGVTDQHKIPMTGTINWDETMTALRDIGFNGWYNLENDITHFGQGFEKEEAIFSTKVMMHMLKLRDDGLQIRAF